jgi:hypothetical protein
MLTIRHSNDGSVSMVWDTDADEPVRCPTQDDMDTMPVGEDLTDADVERLDD